jgi:hypothetical protein
MRSIKWKGIDDSSLELKTKTKNKNSYFLTLDQRRQMAMTTWYPHHQLVSSNDLAQL